MPRPLSQRASRGHPLVLPLAIVRPVNAFRRDGRIEIAPCAPGDIHLKLLRLRRFLSGERVVQCLLGQGIEALLHQPVQHSGIVPAIGLPRQR